MESSENSLDVLSHAAILMEGNAKGDMDQRDADLRSSPSKELPTKEQKLKRSKDRREFPSTPPIRLRIKSNSFQCPSDNETDGDTDGGDSSLSPHSPDCGKSVSPIPLSFHNNHALKNSVLSNCHVDSTTGGLLSYKELICYSEQTALDKRHVNYESNDFTEEYDQPLDMSTKCVRDLDSVTSPVSTGVNNVQIHQQQRPSVITCASALLKSQCNMKDPIHQGCRGVDTDIKIVGNDNESTCNENCSDCSSTEDSRPGHRREVLSGMCDPVIDEHFRRSLGKDYADIFAPNSTSVSITVDDHFAKALGDTWVLLQQSKPGGKESSSSSASNSVPTSQSSAFLQHSPGMVST